MFVLLICLKHHQKKKQFPNESCHFYNLCLFITCFVFKSSFRFIFEMKKWFPSFNGPLWNWTSRGGAARPWSRISFHGHACHFVGWSLRQRDFIPLRVVKLSTVNHWKKSWCFFHLSSSTKTKTTTIHSKLSWCNLEFFFLSHFQIAEIFRVFLNHPISAPGGVARCLRWWLPGV